MSFVPPHQDQDAGFAVRSDQDQARAVVPRELGNPPGFPGFPPGPSGSTVNLDDASSNFHQIRLAACPPHGFLFLFSIGPSPFMFFIACVQP